MGANRQDALGGAAELDVPAAADFYRRILGFRTDEGAESPEYRVVWRDNAAVHFAKGERAPTGVRIFFRVKDVNALYAEVIDRGATIAAPIETRSYGIRDLSISDLLCALIVLGGCSHRPGAHAPPPAGSLAPRGDHLEHVASRDDSAYFHLHRMIAPVRAAMHLVAALDSAHIGKAIVASFAYFPGAPDAVPDATRDEYTRVRAENDWVAGQVAQYPDRLVGFCAVNPLREYALREIARCRPSGLPGLKLHLANARMDFSNPADVEKVRAAFAAANAERLPIIVHLRGVSPTYGARDARTFIERILPAAPDVPVQLAHLAGWGGYDAANDETLAAFIAAMESGEIDRSRLFFDLASVFHVQGAVAAGPRTSSWTPVIIRRMREIGLDRILFATDGDSHRAVASFLLNESGLTRDEVHRVFDNLAPYLR